MSANLTKFLPSSAESLANERKLRQLAKKMFVTKTDTSDLDAYLLRFKNACMRVRELTGIARFRGTYDELFELQVDLSQYPAETADYLERLKLLDSMVNSEAKKLGLSGKQWLERCWHDEIVADAKQPYAR